MAEDVDLYFPGMHGSHRPSSTVEPVSVGWNLAETLEKPWVGGHVEVVIAWQVVGVRWYWPEGHWKTQQTLFLMMLLGAHGGAVELVVEEVLHPSLVHVRTHILRRLLVSIARFRLGTCSETAESVLVFLKSNISRLLTV